ncbi:hypothetical protein DRO24_03510 [Candidatus Bathyarchaeota archaeon]|nr:MAG: hypothetical protein DRO24_03510 [Candidatus Bathyarchaeota archaeon]
MRAIITKEEIPPTEDIMEEQYWLGWLAGIIDGEGGLGIAKHNHPAPRSRNPSYTAYLYIDSTSKELIETVKRIIGGGKVYLVKRKNLGMLEGKVKNPKPVYRYYTRSHNLLRKILPKLRLVVKEKQRQLILKMLSLMYYHGPSTNPNLEELEKIYQEVKSCSSKSWNRNTGN